MTKTDYEFNTPLRQDEGMAGGMAFSMSHQRQAN
jgi:hypothetical protein